MSKQLHVGNIDAKWKSPDLEKLFSSHGKVQSVRVILDRDTGVSKGFGFVQMMTEADAKTAIAKLNGTEHGGKVMTVSEAKPK